MDEAFEFWLLVNGIGDEMQIEEDELLLLQELQREGEQIPTSRQQKRHPSMD